MVSRNSPRKNDFDKFAKFPSIEGKNREERKQPRTLLKNPPNKMGYGKMKRHLLFAWVLASVPVFIPQYLSLNFVFCEYLFEGWERELVKFRLPSVFGKGEFSDLWQFHETPEGIQWPATVSQNHRGKVFGLWQFHETPEGIKWPATVSQNHRGKVFWSVTVSRNPLGETRFLWEHEQPRPLPHENTTTTTLPTVQRTRNNLCCGCLFLVPVLSTKKFSLTFCFVLFWVRG